MAQLFDKDGSYNYTKFTGASGVWSIHGTETNGEYKNTLDTFYNGKGEFRTFERNQVWEQARLGNIKPVEESKIIFKDNSKTKRRSV